ncbi:MAG TPA: hypothetical protein PLV59_01860 [Candidatus Dojkabacteria bacterium]|nr:hypothetical protein [Candidatus Dojkabacteria bacterium]
MDQLSDHALDNLFAELFDNLDDDLRVDLHSIAFDLSTSPAISDGYAKQLDRILSL